MISKKTLIQTAFWLMVATFGSRILGFLREVQLAYYFGLSDMRGAFTVAFKIPNLIRTLIADAAISAAFIPVFTELLIKKDRNEAWKVGSQMFNVTFLLLTAIVILSEIFMPTIIYVTTPGFAKNPDLFNHTIYLSRIIFPIIVILGVGGVVVGILHSMNHFSAPAVAPIFWNMVNIAAVFYFQKTYGIYAAAWGLLVATFIQLIIQGAPFFKIDWKYYFSLGLSHPAIKQVGILIIPVTLSIGVINFNALINNFFASLLGPAPVVAIDSAFRLFQLPQGLFAIAIGTVLFPTLSTLVVQNNTIQFSRAITMGLRQVFYITLPFSGWFIALSIPLSQFCFERGNFTHDDTKMVAWALLFYAIGLAFSSANVLLNRAFYSLKKTWIPLQVGIINMILNAFFSWLFMQFLGHGGICLSTSLVSIFNFFALVYLLRKEVSDFIPTPLWFALFRMVFLTAAIGVISALVIEPIHIALGGGNSLWTQAITLGGAIGISGIGYILLSYIFKFKELKESMGILP